MFVLAAIIFSRLILKRSNSGMYKMYWSNGMWDKEAKKRRIEVVIDEEDEDQELLPRNFNLEISNVLKIIYKLVGIKAKLDVTFDDDLFKEIPRSS